MAVGGLSYPRATPLLSQADAINISISFADPLGAPAPVLGLAVGQVQIDSIPQSAPILLQVPKLPSEALLNSRAPFLTYSLMQSRHERVLS